MTGRSLFRTVVVVVAAALTLAGCARNDPEHFIASAESYIAKKDYRAAIIELKNALGKAPDNARARFLLAKALLDSGDSINAATEFRKAIALNYSADEAYPLLARALIQQSTPKKEILELANAPVTSAHAKAEVAAMLAVGYIGLGQRKDAHEKIDAALALEPANVSARVAQAQLTAIEGNLLGAIGLADAVLASAPENIDALMLKGDLEVALQRRADAAKTYERVIALRPDTIRARYGLISGLVQSKELDKAALQVEEVKKLAPTDPRTLHAIAFLAFSRGDTQGALDSVQKAVQAAPEYLPARYLSGLVDLQRGSLASAEQSLRIVVAQAPNEDGARVALAETYLRRGQAAKADEILEP
ncbi:MAG: tetratricopeptide repeat protein, partial [Casimicrobiaceae bacterium]